MRYYDTEAFVSPKSGCLESAALYQIAEQALRNAGFLPPSKECKIKAGRRAINSARKGENNEAPETIWWYNNESNLQEK